MHIIGIGYRTIHGKDFEITRPCGYGEYLLLLMETSSFHVLNAQKQIYPAQSVILYDKTTPQHYGSAGENYVDNWIHFSMEPEELLWLERNHIHLSTMISLTDAEPIAELIRQMSLEFYSADSLRDSTLNLYMQILSNKISDLSGTGENGILRPLYDQLVQLRADIYNRPAVQRKIEEEAERLLISTSYLQHMYKKIFGVTLINDVIHSRIDYSCKLLTGTDFTIQKIAESCGYEYDVYFMRQFKMKMGMTPREYRKRYAG